jgi:AraC-like DNA-binding protein
LARLETLSTAGLEPRQKIDFWNATACECFTPMTCDVLDIRSFQGSMTRTMIGDLRVVEARSDPQLVHHSKAHVSWLRQQQFFLQFQLEGSCVIRQDGREAQLRPGDFMISDTARPFAITFESPNSMLVLGIPQDVLRRHIAFPERVVALPMSGAEGVNSLLTSFLRNLWRLCQTEFDSRPAPRISHAILDLIAGAYAKVPAAQSDRSALATAHRLRIINHIETHLGDPELTPTRVAEACRITPRHLHHIFADQPETAARYILRRRLEECARALVSEAFHGRTVTAIAFEFGFNNQTHFGRAFRARYGCTPSEYRRLKS